MGERSPFLESQKNGLNLFPKKKQAGGTFFPVELVESLGHVSKHGGVHSSVRPDLIYRSAACTTGVYFNAR